MENFKQFAGDNSRLKDPRASEISLNYINSLGYFASECVKFFKNMSVVKCKTNL